MVNLCTTVGRGQKEKKEKEKERCFGAYRQAVGFLVIKDDSISSHLRLNL